MKRLLAVVILVAACSNGSGGGGGGAPPPAKAWTLDVTSMKYSTTTFVGGTLKVTAIISNTGGGANPGVSLQFNDIKDYADIVGCTPTCTTDEGLGDIYARLPGIAAGATSTYEIEFIPTQVGAAHWSVCVYDTKTGGDQVYCGDGTTTIR